MTLLPRLLALFAFALPAMPAFATSEADLLPVDQAFGLTASAPSRDRIEVQWKVADGYYLYRHRIDVQVEGPGFQAGKLQLPKGKAYRDEFFGDVETYHQDLIGVLAGEAAAATDSVALKVKYQGCADAGICYPPQTRRLVVKLPAAGSTTGLAGPLGPTNAGGLPRFGQSAAAASGAIEALPLPQEQAFAFEAIAYDGNQLMLRFTPAPGYYLYRDRTTMKLEGARHIAVGRPRWPKGDSHRDEHFGQVVVYFSQAEVPVPLLRTSGEAATATLKVTFQGCQKDGICYPPMTRAVPLSIPKGEVTPAAGASEVTAPPLVAALPGASPNATAPAADSGLAIPAVANADATQEVARTTPPADVLRKANRSTSVWLALLLALAGGLVLNLMPCVLPVLSLKALSLADSGRGGSHARASALWYTAGVLLCFIAIGAIALGLRAAGQVLGWGFQLQQPLVIGALVYLMFAVGLSLSGVFALGHRFAGAGHELTGRSGPAGDFFTGVLAVVIASPCTAPFMGAALAFAFTASTPVALLVFAFLGLGLALPFLLIGFVPGLAQRLPKPGAWMETLKHFLAFPMYLTAVWLLWVLGKQRGVDAIGLALIGLVLLALGLWWYQRLRLQVAPLRRTLAVLLLLAAVVPLGLVHRLPREATGPASTTAVAGIVPYSAAKLAALRAEGRVVFVDMTADWCVTCKANEKAVLGRDEFHASMQQADAVFMQGDWTNVDPAITEFLEAHHAVGVPLYVVFPSDGGEGEILPAVLTQDRVAEALARAKR